MQLTPSEARVLGSLIEKEITTPEFARMCAPAEQRPEAIVVQLARQPGMKEQRYAHTLGDPAELAAAALVSSSVHTPADAGLAGRVERLEAAVEELKSALESLSKTTTA